MCFKSAFGRLETQISNIQQKGQQGAFAQQESAIRKAGSRICLWHSWKLLFSHSFTIGMFLVWKWFSTFRATYTTQRLCHSLLQTTYVSPPIPDPPLLAYMFWKLPLSLIPSKISSMLHLQKLLHGHCHIPSNTAERKSISGPSSHYPLHVIKTTILFIVVYIWGRKWDGCCQRCRGELSIMWLRNKERG